MVSEAARRKWPGNQIPTFYNNPTNMAELDNLVTKLLPECSLTYFNKKHIRQHILDTLTERRRNVKRGHDYDNVGCDRECYWLIAKFSLTILP